MNIQLNIVERQQLINNWNTLRTESNLFARMANGEYHYEYKYGWL